MFALFKQQTNSQVREIGSPTHSKTSRQSRNAHLSKIQGDSSISHNKHSWSIDLVCSDKNIPLTFSKHNKSRRSSIRFKYKQNSESNKHIGSDSKIKFSQLPPKRKSNFSKLSEQEAFAKDQSALDETKGMIPIQNRFLKYSKRGIENFVILKKLGEGSYGQVFKALQKQTNSLYALKIVNKQGLRQNQLINRLISQLKIQLYCNHLNIVKLYGVFQDEESIYLIQQYAGENTLYSLMQDQKKTKYFERESQSIIRQICSAVRYLHANHIIHRDIKPENILVATGGVVKLTDFGWSIYNPQHQMRRTICGTPLYLSPELIMVEQYNETVDIWAVGVLVYEILSGQMPFGIRCIQDLHNIVTEDIDLSIISDPLAKQFLRMLLVKQIKSRKSMDEICEHKYVVNPTFD